jgi:hypothetical protein
MDYRSCTIRIRPRAPPACLEPAADGAAAPASQWCRTPIPNRQLTGREFPTAKIFNDITPLPGNSENFLVGNNRRARSGVSGRTAECLTHRQGLQPEQSRIPADTRRRFARTSLPLSRRGVCRCAGVHSHLIAPVFLEHQSDPDLDGGAKVRQRQAVR